jgi:hypothetical protein
VIYLGRKNISRGKNRDITDFSHLITKSEETTENETKESEVRED